VSAIFHYYPANLTIRCFQMKYGSSYVTAGSTSILDVDRKYVLVTSRCLTHSIRCREIRVPSDPSSSNVHVKCIVVFVWINVSIPRVQRMMYNGTVNCDLIALISEEISKYRKGSHHDNKPINRHPSQDTPY
jgi:hypothetical protein